MSPRARGPLALLALLCWCGVEAAAIRPTDPAQVIERVPPRVDADWRAIRAAREALAANPADAATAAALAERYEALAMQDGEPRYLGWAEAALAPWWSAPEPPLPALKARARIRQARHEFPAARADLRQALQRAPRDADAWLAYAGVLLVEGELAAARQACARVLLLADALTAATCAAQAAPTAAAARAGAATLARLLDTARAAGDQARRRWAWTTLAELEARLGTPAAAERAFRAALMAGRPDVYLLASYADFLLAADRAADAFELLAARPAADALLLRQAIAARRLGRPDARRLAARLEARFAALAARNDQSHAREEAWFALRVLDDPARALPLAARNYARQRELADARLLIEAALGAGRPADAAPALDWMRRHGAVDPALMRLAARVEGAR